MAHRTLPPGRRTAQPRRLVGVAPAPPGRPPLNAKRVLDAVVAAAALTALAPVIAVVSVAVLAESRGPVFYRAPRVGYRGRRLRMLKFRKMHAGAGGVALTGARDERLTRVGALLARTRLDEVPQLWHVLTGEMSLVGPRPEDPGFVAQRPDDFRDILSVRPGITGLSQLAFAEERSILDARDPVTDYLRRILPQKCALDRLYVQRAGVRTDLRVLRWTVVAVVLRRPVAVDRRTGALRLRRRAATRP